jgi:hypothetical protein
MNLGFPRLVVPLTLLVAFSDSLSAAPPMYRGANVTKEWEEVRHGTQTRALDDFLKTKANVVRIPWIKYKLGTEAETIQRVQKMADTARNSGRLVILDNHEYTGWGYAASHDSEKKVTNIKQIVNDWLLLKDYLVEESDIVVNIANEWGGTGDSSMNDEIWRNQYLSGIKQLRRNGIKNTLMIDANEWGQSASSILRYGKQIMAADPLKKTFFSVHVYNAWTDSDPSNLKGKYHIETTLKQLKENGTPAFVGEFGNSYGPRNDNNGDTYHSASVVQAAEKYSLGWTAWSWTRAPDLDDTNKAFRDDSLTSNGGDPEKLSTFGKIMVDAFDDGQFNGIAKGL